MLQFNFNPFPVLTTNRLVLRQTTHDDAREVFFLRSDEEVMKYIDRPRATSMQDVTTFIDLINGNIKTNDGITWAITTKDSPELIGSIGFWNMQPEHHRAGLGYVLHPNHQGKGIMSEAIKAVLDYGFQTMKLHSVEAQIDPENNASARALERAGFIREGYFKENYFFDGRYADSAVYSLVNG